ncbi:MAG: biotin carboxyl carrier protein [Gammaproteobacteria bacterium]|jgi:biotin carboxyl carrier protein
MNPRTQSWLEVQCTTIPGVARGVVLLRADTSNGLEVGATWPSGTADTSEELLDAASQAAKTRSSIVRVHNGKHESSEVTVIGSAIRAGAIDYGAVALELPSNAHPQHQAVLQLLQWGSSWFELLHRDTASELGNDRVNDVLELLVSGLEHQTFSASATALVTELAGRFDCERVSLGLLKGKQVQVEAMSHSAHIDTRTNLAREIGDAMDEAIDQDATVAFPSIQGAAPVIAFAQEVLSDHSGHAAVCTTPLFAAGDAIGGLTFERPAGKTFDAKTAEVLEAVAALLGPIVSLKFEHDRSVGYKAWAAARGSLKRLIGAGQYTLKLNVVLATAAILFFSVAKGDYRVTAPAALEGRVQRAITAPQDGYIAGAFAQAGDKVTEGQILGTLDSADLELERAALNSQREQSRKEHRVALSTHDRAAAAIAQAQTKQIDVQIKLVDAKLTRVRLVAPFSGVVVTGDLSQSLGSPVKHGQVLFRIAPLDSYRVILNVDERDIGAVETSQRGHLALTGFPDKTIPLLTVRVVPVSVTEDGSNYFRVEAALEETDPLLRPGMEGIAKLDVEERSLIWIWSHTLLDWLRLSLWSWIA